MALVMAWLQIVAGVTSENRAAVTFIIAVDENKHLLPGVCESHLTFVMYADHFLIRVCPPICK
jgi:hypothetical protein